MSIDDGIRELLEELMRRTHLSAPSDLAGVVVAQVRASLAARDAAELRDDATALLVEWRAGDELRLMPQTVL